MKKLPLKPIRMIGTGYDHSGKLPPQDIATEEAVIGAMLQDTKCVGDVCSIIGSEDFYKESNKMLFITIRSLFNEGKAIDFITVVTELRKRDELVNVGGPAHIAELTRIVAGTGNVEVWARYLKEMGIKRNLIAIGTRLVSDSYDNSVDTFELLDRINTISSIVDTTIGGGIKKIDRVTEMLPDTNSVFFCGKSFASAGNFSMIIAPPGTGKSNLLDAISGNAINNNSDGLGFSVNLYGKKVLYLDTERSHNDTKRGEERIFCRIGQKDADMRKLDIYRLKEAGLEERKSHLRKCCMSGEYSLVLIDMITDFVMDDNSYEETGELILMLGVLASKYSLAIICTIHDNPMQSVGDNKGKASGVIGSKMMKKAESVVYMHRLKENKEIVEVTTDFAFGKSRNSSFGGRSRQMIWDRDIDGFKSMEVQITPEKLEALSVSKRTVYDHCKSYIATNVLSTRPQVIEYLILQNGKTDQYYRRIISELVELRYLVKDGIYLKIGNIAGESVVNVTESDEF
jgi:hypothetical protein